jgi:hypothetical protein
MTIKDPSDKQKSSTALERQFRSRLTKLISDKDGLLRGTLTVRERTCGKASCKCYQGQKHSSLYLVISVEGKYQQICLPKIYEDDVRAWVANYQRIQELLEEISQIYLDKIKNRQV